MAKGKSKRSKAPAQINAQIQADVRPDTPFYYINYLSINHSAYDFTMTAVKLPSHFTADQIASARQGKPVLVEPVLQLVIPPRVIKGLINALTEQCRKYEAQFGPIPINGAKK